MSEIKGQLLGIIIVLAIFAAISTAMVPFFTKMANKIETNVSSVVDDRISKI